MKASLLDDATRAQLAVRAQQLTAEARPAWGRMGVVAMLNHLNLSFQSASGELRLQRALIGPIAAPSGCRTTHASTTRAAGAPGNGGATA